MFLPAHEEFVFFFFVLSMLRGCEIARRNIIERGAAVNLARVVFGAFLTARWRMNGWCNASVGRYLIRLSGDE